MIVVFGVEVDLTLLWLDDGVTGTKVLDVCGLLTVQGQSVMVKVVDLVIVYVLELIVNVVGVGADSCKNVGSVSSPCCVLSLGWLDRV